jgi:hypothetical protein
MEEIMPWTECTAMGQKREFIEEWLSGAYTITELCRGFDISRPTAYKYIQKWKEMGDKGLNELGRTPHFIHNKTTPEIEEARGGPGILNSFSPWDKWKIACY